MTDAGKVRISENRGGRSVSIVITGPDQDSVAQACNAYLITWPTMGYGTSLGRLVETVDGWVCHGLRSASCD